MTVDLRCTHDDVVSELADGMTIGIGGWGSRRKPMSLVRAICRSSVRDLTVVSYGGPDVGLLCRANKVKRVVFGFVTLDSIPLEPNFRRARESGSIEVTELDEGMIYLGLQAAAWRVPFLPTRAGLGSDIMRVNPTLRTVRSPYGDDEVVAVPPLALDVAIVHMNRADARGDAQFLGPDIYFDDLFCQAAAKAFVSAERVGDLDGPVQSARINRSMIDGVVEAPGGAHFTSCVPDYDRDEAFQRAYVEAATGDWDAFRSRYLDVDEANYQRAVR